MKLNHIIILSVALLCGCAAKTGNPVMKDSESGLNRQMEPLKTKADVRDIFGAPDLVFQKDNLEVYEYRRIDGHGQYYWLFPVIGWFISLFDDRFTYEETNLFVRFDKKDYVKDWNMLQTGGTMN